MLNAPARPGSDDDHLAEIDQLMCDRHPLPDRDQ
jgi:hypothetical protein